MIKENLEKIQNDIRKYGNDNVRLMAVSKTYPEQAVREAQEAGQILFGENRAIEAAKQSVSSPLLETDIRGATDAIINITNDNWFGKTPGTYQHLDMVRRYAIESGLPIIRANFSGISAFVASDGTIISSLPVGMSGVLDGFVWGAHTTQYREIGLNYWMMIILIVSILGTVVFSKIKK